MPLTPGMLRSSSNHVDRVAGGQVVERGAAAVRMDHAEAFALQHRLAETPLRRVVVDDENRLVHLKTPTNKCAAPSRAKLIFCALVIQADGKGGVSET